ncbi:hypothetical protein HanIR_Chr09g0407371 [Helianthus annuus]|nr:hypothetical protein HanIR_Chr09g0407371 [Helianthus annuus]
MEREFNTCYGHASLFFLKFNYYSQASHKKRQPNNQQTPKQRLHYIERAPITPANTSIV